MKHTTRLQERNEGVPARSKSARRKSSPSLIQRFNGRGGKRRLIDVLRNQFLVAGNQEIAVRLAKHATPHELGANRLLLEEGNSDNDLYFVLSGSVSVKVSGREVAKRVAGEHVGEMAMLDTTALRSATVHTVEPTVVANVSESAFSRIANKHPELWRRVALALASRLRERAKFHTPPRTEPVIFVGSSTEGLEIAQSIHRYLRRFSFVPRLWSDDVFECSKTTIEDLMRATRETDFSVLVLTADDVTRSRGRKKPSPRDNVIFELGLFMGALNRDRTYIVAPKSADLKIPTDLLGLTLLQFRRRRGESLARSLQPVLRALRKLIHKHGPI